MAVFVVLLPYLSTTKLRCLQKNNLGHTIPGELEELNKPHFGEETEVDGPEEACDAEQFFDGAKSDLEKIKEEFSKEIVDNCDSDLLKVLHERFFDTSATSKLPKLPREYFVHLWKNLHDLIEFGNLKDTTMEGRDQMYQSITCVGTLLLQIGEVGQRVKGDFILALPRSFFFKSTLVFSLSAFTNVNTNR